MSAGILKTRITWGPLGPPAPPTLPVVAAPRPVPTPLPPPAPVEAPMASYGVASGVLTLAGRSYAWSFRVRNPYLPVELGADPEALRKWQIAVVRDLVRHKVADPSACRTARSWANLSWHKVAKAVNEAVRQQKTPKTPRSCRLGLAMALMALHVPGGAPGAFAGGPKALTNLPRKMRLRRLARVLPLIPTSVTDPATGERARTPRRLPLAVYRARFPNDPVPPMNEKKRRGDLVTVAVAYRGLWAESLRRALCGKQGGRGKKKLRPAPAAAEAERSETPPDDLSRA